MANHCWNWSSFTGSREDLEKLIANVEKAKALNEGNGISLWYRNYSVALGLPPWQEGDPDYDVYDRYGSKWFDVDIDDNQDHVILVGSSAWSPMCEFFRKLSAVYNLDVYAEYEEPGMDFGGFFSASVGEVTRDEQLSYNQYRVAQDGGESLLESLDRFDFESVEEAVNHFEDLKQVMSGDEWKEFESDVRSVFEDTKEESHD